MLQYFWRRKRDERGFTLIELLIVVAIIAILAAILIPNFLRARGQARVSATKGNLKNIGTALESYYVSANQYTGGLAGLSPDYIRAVPTRPDGGGYGYVTGSGNQDYVVCDSVTDNGITTSGTVTAWYYTPSGGLSSMTAGSAGAAISVGGLSCDTP